MKFSKLKQDKGVAGLTLLLSLVTMLFVIGLLVMIFAMMGGEFKGTDSLSASESTTEEQVAIYVNATGTPLTTCTSANQGILVSISHVYNVTGNLLISAGNYSFSACTISFAGGTVGTDINYSASDGGGWNVTYIYTYAGDGWNVINDSTSAIGTVTDWFDIFIVIGAMVVLILLTVIIITAIRGSGLMVGSGGKSGNVGSA